MKLPHFIIVGAQKSGTTWLGRILGQHPDIYFCPKEIDFFSYQSNLVKGLKYYSTYFERSKKGQIIGEKSPSYLNCIDGKRFYLTENIDEIIKDNLPDVKIIIILRDPVKRAISAYNHNVRLNNINPLSNISKSLIRLSEYEKIKHFDRLLHLKCY